MKKKVVVLVLVLLALIILLKNIFNVKIVKYKIKDGTYDFNIIEKYDSNNYYIEIKSKQNIFPIRVFDNLNNKKKIVEKVYHYKDSNIECILPIINEKVYTDFLCSYENVLYNYRDIYGINEKLDSYVSKISKYNKRQFENFENYKTLSSIKYNKDSNLKNVAITTYTGLIINENVIDLFKQDIYNNELGVFILNYYVVPNYNEKHEFNNFYIVNLDNNKVSNIKVKNEISFDSYIQGIVDGCIYLYDRDNEIQYKIDVKSKKISIISDSKYVKYYKNNKWEKLNIEKANKKIYFDYESLDNYFPDYDYVKEGKYYYYLFKKEGINYKLYRADKDNLDSYKYISTISINDINIFDDYFYYKDKNKIYYYSDITGTKTVIYNPELEFNDTIKYYIY